MKNILTISILLIGMIGWGQQAKLDRWYFLYMDGDTSTQCWYVYDSANNLKSIHYYAENWFFEEGKCVKKEFGNNNNDYTYYEYFSDTLIVVTSPEEYPYPEYVYYYYLNEDGFIYKWHDKDNEYVTDILWHEGNAVKTYMNGVPKKSREYYNWYRNPFYEESKYFKNDGIFGFGSGSHNMIKHYDTTQFYEVADDINGFPTKVNWYFNGNLLRIYHYEYRSITSDTPEIPIEPYTVHSVDYFDLMGRKIPKPTSGFYIERKTTDKGVISKKYFIH